jgi:hypothetical protein
MICRARLSYPWRRVQAMAFVAGLPDFGALLAHPDASDVAIPAT